jgi:hypothetical protein
LETQNNYISQIDTLKSTITDLKQKHLESQQLSDLQIQNLNHQLSKVQINNFSQVHCLFSASRIHPKTEIIETAETYLSECTRGDQGVGTVLEGPGKGDRRGQNEGNGRNAAGAVGTEEPLDFVGKINLE